MGLADQSQHEALMISLFCRDIKATENPQPFHASDGICLLQQHIKF